MFEMNTCLTLFVQEICNMSNQICGNNRALMIAVMYFYIVSVLYLLAKYNELVARAWLLLPWQRTSNDVGDTGNVLLYTLIIKFVSQP